MTSAAANGSGHRYQRWAGRRGQSARRGWLTMAARGLRLEYARPATQRLVWVGFAFILGIGVVLYLLSLLETIVGTADARPIYGFIQTFLGVDLSGVARIGEFRAVLWRTVFLAVFKIELFWVMVVVARTGPGLIANDLKARALPIYFARPITPLTYLLGKWLVAAGFIALVTVVPNLLALLGAVLVTGGLETWGQTLSLAADLVLAGLGVMVFGGILVLALSSLTSDSRYVAVGWLAVCLLSAIAQSVVNVTVAAAETTRFLGSISLQQNVITVAEWLFGMKAAWGQTPLPTEAFVRPLTSSVEPLYPAIVLLVITVLACAVCYRNVLRFSRSAANC